MEQGPARERDFRHWSGVGFSRYNHWDKKYLSRVFRIKLRASSKETHRAMKLTAKIPVLIALAALLGASTGCNQLKSRDQINKGVAAFKNAQYEEAVSHFQTAVALDPKSANAKLYLATSYSYQVVPNLKTPENLAVAQKALDGFNEVLAKNANDLTALKQVATIYRNIGKLDLSKQYEQRVVDLSPNDSEAFYTIGTLDWMTEHYNNTVPILAADGLTDNGEGNVKMTKGACAKIQVANKALVDDAIKSLSRAVELNPTYDDAMQYLQLSYRSKANVDCGNEAARRVDMTSADEWVQKAIGARKVNEQKKEAKVGGGVTM